MNAKRLITEAPIDFGGVPDFVEPRRKQKIERGQHGYANNPSFPREPGPGSYPPGEGEPRPGGQIRSYAELIASDVYPKIVRKIARYAGVQPNQLQQMMRNPMALQMMMMQSFQNAVQWEQGHEEELAQEAIDLVLSLPEFQSARQAVDDGTLRIKAQLRPNVDVDDARPEPEDPDEQKQQELQVAQIAQELDLEKAKRRMINMMIQGAAINKNYAFHQIADKLNEINPNLLNTYGLLMAFGEFMYWIMPEDLQNMAMGGGGGGGGAAGKARFYMDEDGVPTIDAQALVLPVLIQELVKGMMEYLSHNEDEDPETRDYVQSQVDTLSNEPEDINFGAGVWRQVLRMIGNENQELMPKIYQAVNKLPTGEFHQRMNQILRGDPMGREFIQRIVDEIRGEMDESAKQVVTKLLD